MFSRGTFNPTNIVRKNTEIFSSQLASLECSANICIVFQLFKLLFILNKLIHLDNENMCYSVTNIRAKRAESLGIGAYSVLKPVVS